MKKLSYLLLILVFGFVTHSCNVDDDDTKPDDSQTVEEMEDLNIEDEFNWKTTDLILLKIQGLHNGTVKVKDQDGKVHHKVFHNMFTHVSTMISLPDHMQNVVIEYNGKSQTVPIIDRKITHSFIE